MCKIMDKKELLIKLCQSNLLSLAFIGDSIHTQYVREYVLSQDIGNMDNYHKRASYFCKASTQAEVLQALLPSLNEEESSIVKRARNAKPKHQAKNATGKDYAYATAFEALIGYTYLKEDNERLNELLNLSLSLKGNTK